MAKFDAKRFVATEWSTADDKAKFANHFFRFLAKGCPESLFHKWFYSRLSMTFGHIAHFNRGGFYDVWFATPAKRLAFIRHAMQYRCCGDPRCTFSDVEREIILRLATSGMPDQFAIKPDALTAKIIDDPEAVESDE